MDKSFDRIHQLAVVADRLPPEVRREVLGHIDYITSQLDSLLVENGRLLAVAEAAEGELSHKYTKHQRVMHFPDTAAALNRLGNF